MSTQSKKEYLVSIVTPFHNVDMRLFRKGYESLKNQTIGFSNIQWIVVLHNTEPSICEAVHQLLDCHENVIVKELNNDVHTPSSPRNCGMKLATAPYLGFLDADDSFTPDCFETVLQRIKKTNSQIVVFRREFEAEQEGLLPTTEIVLWDQTQEEIIIDRDHWDDEKMFTGIWAMVTSRLFTLINFLRREEDNMNLSKAKFTSPRLLLSPPEAMDTLYLRLLFALRERDVEQIVAPYTWGVVEALSFVEAHWEDLCNDIEKGEITFALDVPDSFLRQIGGLMTPDKTRADELRKVFSQGFNGTVVSRIWPKMERVIAMGLGGFRIYTDIMKKYTGNILHSNGMMAVSEMLLGKPLTGTDDFELIHGVNFYEFLPFPEKEDDTPLLFSQAQAGADYEVVVTNHAGFYRYRSGILIHVKENKNGRMIFSCAGRRNQFAIIGDAFLGDVEIYGAIEKTKKEFGVEIADFVYYVSPEESEDQLVIMLEPMEGRNENNVFSPDVTKKIAAFLDAALCDENVAYAAARQAGTPPCTFAWIQSQTQLLYRDATRFRNKTAPDQIRPRHFLNTPAQIKFFRHEVL